MDGISHRIPFLTVYNPRHDDPTTHYHDFARRLHEVIHPTLKVLEEVLNPDNDPDKIKDHVNDGRKILASMDIHQFSPNEISVTIKGEELCIEGKHEEKHDGHGFVARHVTRRIYISGEIDCTDIRCDIGLDGILEISVPQPKKKEDSDNLVRKIGIHYNNEKRPKTWNPTNGMVHSESDAHPSNGFE